MAVARQLSGAPQMEKGKRGEHRIKEPALPARTTYRYRRLALSSRLDVCHRRQHNVLAKFLGKAGTARITACSVVRCNASVGQHGHVCRHCGGPVLGAARKVLPGGASACVLLVMDRTHMPWQGCACSPPQLAPQVVRFLRALSVHTDRVRCHRPRRSHRVACSSAHLTVEEQKGRSQPDSCTTTGSVTSVNYKSMPAN